MKTKLTILFLFLSGFLYSQKLPEVIIDPNIFKNSLQIDRYEVLDSNEVCYQEGHYLLGNHRYITYTTLLANIGDTVAYYGQPSIDTVHWDVDICHGHYHYDPGIKVELSKWNSNSWIDVSLNGKLDYEMANQQKYPAEWRKVFNPATLSHDYVFLLHGQLDEQWFTQYSAIDSEAAKMQCCPAGGGADMFFTYPTVDYNSGNRGILPYFGDEYSNGTEGNSNVIPDSVDGFYRIKAYHTPHFEQRNLFPDTIDVIFYLQGDVIIHDTLPTIPQCNSDTIVYSINAIKLNGGWGTREVILNGISATETCPFQIERLIAIGNNENRWNVSAVLTVNSSEFIDYSAPSKLPICYRQGSIISNKVKYK